MSIRYRSLMLIFLLALGIRVAFVISHSGTLEFPDEQDYHSIARSLLDEGRFQEADGRRASRAPGYPVFLALVYALGADSPRSVFLIQALIGGLSCVLITVLGVRFFGSSVGRWAGAFAAFYPFFIYFTGLLLTETLFIAGFVGFLLLVEMLHDQESGRRIKTAVILVCAGILAGLLVHLRSSFLLFPFFFLPFFLYRNKPRKRALARWGVIILLMLLVLSPWVWRNYRVFGHFIPTTLQAGESLYEANSPYADGGPAMDEAHTPWDELADKNLGEYERDVHFNKLAVDYILENPRRFVGLALNKFKRFWNVVPNNASYRTPFYLVVSLCSYLPILILGMVGVLAYLRRGSRLAYVLSPVLYFTALHMVFVGSLRYRVAVMPFVIILAGAGTDFVWTRASNYFSPAPAAGVRWKRWVFIIVPAILFVGGAIVYRYYTDPERLRTLTEKRLAVLAGGDVIMSEAAFKLRRGLILKGVRIRATGMPEEAPAMELGTLRLRPNWGALLKGKVLWRTVEMADVNINAQFDKTGRWRFLEQINLASVALGAPGEAPEIHVSNANIRVAGLTTTMGPLSELNLTNVDAILTPGEDDNTLEARVWSRKGDLGRPSVFLRLLPSERRLEGRFTMSGLIVDQRRRELLPEKLREQWDASSPIEAQVDADMQFTWTDGIAGPLHLEGDVRVRNAAFDYRPMRQAVRSLSVEILVADRTFRIQKFKASVGKALVSGSGDANIDDLGRIAGQIAFRADGLALDENSHRLLPPAFREEWQRCQPQGTINVRGHVEKKVGERRPDLFTEVELVNCAFRLPGKPDAVEQVTGWVTYGKERLDLREIKGVARGGSFEALGGFINLTPQGAFDIKVRCRDFGIDGKAADVLPSQVLENLPENVREPTKELALKGAVDFSLRVYRDEESAPTHFASNLTVRGATVAHPLLDHPLSNLLVRAIITETSINLHEMSARWNNAEVAVLPVKLEIAPHAAKRIGLKLKNIPLDESLLKLLDPSVGKVVATCEAAGMLDIDLTLERPAGPTGEFVVGGIVQVRNGRYCYNKFPFPVESVAGTVELMNARLSRIDVRGHNGATKVHLKIHDEPFNGKPGQIIWVKGRDAEFNAPLRHALHARLQSAWDVLQPKGGLDITYSFHYPTQPRQWNVFVSSTKLQFENATADFGAPTEIMNGVVEFTQRGPSSRANSLVTGSFSAENVRAKKLEVTRMTGAFECTDKAVSVQNVDGDFYGGKVNSWLWLPSVSGDAGNEQFRGAFSVIDADAARVAEAGKLGEMSGRFDVYGGFLGKVGRRESSWCRGALEVRDGELGKLPGLLSLLNYFKLRGLGTPAFHAVELAYEFKDHEFLAREVNLLGASMSLRGKGIMKRDKSLDFRFRMEIIGDSGIPMVDPVMKALKDILIPITLKGTKEAPVWQVRWPVPFIDSVPKILNIVNPLKLLGRGGK